MSPPTNLASLVKIFIDLINPLLLIIAGLALLAFFKGLIAFIAKSGDTKTHQEGKNLMIWGILALFIMISVLGILRFLYSDFGFTRPFGLPVIL